jgi:hypothetical protein
MPATHFDAALREHRRLFRINGRRGSVMLASALKVLEEYDEPIKIALERVRREALGCGTEGEIRAALRLLVEGPEGEFR